MLGIDEDLEIRELTTKEKITQEIIPMIIFTIALVSMTTIYLLYENNRNIPKHKEVMVGNKKINVDFDRKFNESLYYVDKENNEYIFTDDKLTGYSKRINRFTQNESSENDIKLEKIEDIVNLFNIKLENYVLEQNGNDYLYVKYINGIKTSDGIFVSLNESGTLKTFESNKLGAFDNLETSVTKEQIEEYIKEEVSKISKFSNYKILSMVLDYKNDDYIVDCYIKSNNEQMKIIYNL